jgi:hypothetical protein
MIPKALDSRNAELVTFKSTVHGVVLHQLLVGLEGIPIERIHSVFPRKLFQVDREKDGCTDGGKDFRGPCVHIPISTSVRRQTIH